jgi:2-oxoglutarate ferredoxin oxidoreductase subunit gamma
VLLIGQLLAQAGMLAGRQVCWMPSYGPEMRGGTASCSVTIADAEIGAPLIQNPTVLVAMNGPSVDRFGKDVPAGGTLIYNASMFPTPRASPASGWSRSPPTRSPTRSATRASRTW